jgi:hypothetical protein
VKPLTLFVNKAALTGESHSRLTWGAAQAGVASGVLWAVADDVVSAADVDDLLLIAAVWVDPHADVETLVYKNGPSGFSVGDFVEPMFGLTISLVEYCMARCATPTGIDSAGAPHRGGHNLAPMSMVAASLR